MEHFVPQGEHTNCEFISLGNSMEHFVPQGEHTICEFISLGTPWNILFHKVNTLFVSSFFGELHGTFHSAK
jgi:hypothetical protein